MGLFEDSPLPGAPYLVAGVLSIWALLHCYELPPQPELVIAKFKAMESGDGEGEGLLNGADDASNHGDDDEQRL